MIQQDVPLKDHTSFHIGGSAKYFLKASSLEELRNGLVEWKKISVSLTDDEKRIFVLGGGTNLLISENGFPGLVIHSEIKFIEKIDGSINVGSGEALSSLVNFCMENSLSGFEWAGGLPGTVGGAVRGNAGAFGGETKDNVFEVESLNIETLEIKKRNGEQCNFGYRESIFKSGEGKDEMITSAKFVLEEGDMDSIKAETDDHIEYRRSKHPLHFPNAGSIFKNVAVEKVSADVLAQFEGSIKNDPFPVLPVARILASSGLVSKKIGGAQVSEAHPNFIVNVENATFQNVKDLIAFEQETVKEKFGIDLEPEIMFVE